MEIRRVLFGLCASAGFCALGGDWGQAVSLSPEGRKFLLESSETYSQASMLETKRWPGYEGVSSCEDFDGRKCLHFHVEIDHKGGNKTHPIGWPRTYFSPKPDEQIWGKYESFNCSIYVKQKNETTQRNALSIGITQVDKKNVGRKLFFTTDLKMNAWNDLCFPLNQVPEDAKLRNLGVIISESDFDHGDCVDIYVSNLYFRRSSRGAIGTMRVEDAILTTDSQVLPVELDVLGNGAEGIPFALLKDGRVLRKESLPLKRGLQSIRLDVSELKLVPGDYSLVAYPDEKALTLSSPVRVITSPWSEAK